MSASSNLFLCDALDIPHPVELAMYTGALRFRHETEDKIIDNGNSSKMSLSVLYLFLVFGDEKYVKIMSLLGTNQESLFSTIVELLNIGNKFKPEVLKNLTKYITTFYPHIIHNMHHVLLLIRATFQYSALIHDDKDQCRMLLSTIIQIISRTAEVHSDDANLLSQLGFVLGRLFVEHHNIFGKDIDFFVSVLNRNSVHQQGNDREIIRSCLELSGVYEFKPFLSSIYAKNMMLVTSNQYHLQMRIPTWFWSNVTFILDNIGQQASPDYLKMLNLDSLSEEFRVDLIRALVCCYHPPNKILASGNIQRWSLILTILKGFKNPSSVASAKLAIFFDWILDTPDLKRNVMLFEPGCFLISRSNSDMVKLSLLEYLFLCSKDFCPHLPSKDNIAAVFRVLVELGVMKWKDLSIPKSSPPYLIEFINELQSLGAVAAQSTSKEKHESTSKSSIDTRAYLGQIMQELEQLKRAFLLKHQTSQSS